MPSQVYENHNVHLRSLHVRWTCLKREVFGESGVFFFSCSQNVSLHSISIRSLIDFLPFVFPLLMNWQKKFPFLALTNSITTEQSKHINFCDGFITWSTWKSMQQKREKYNGQCFFFHQYPIRSKLLHEVRDYVSLQPASSEKNIDDHRHDQQVETVDLKIDFSIKKKKFITRTNEMSYRI